LRATADAYKSTKIGNISFFNGMKERNKLLLAQFKISIKYVLIYFILLLIFYTITYTLITSKSPFYIY